MVSESSIYETKEVEGVEESAPSQDDSPDQDLAVADAGLSRPNAASVRSLGRYWRRAQAGSQIGLFVLALFYTAYVARSVLQPLVVATLLFFILHPAVKRLTRAGLPVALASFLLVSSLVGVIGFVSYELSGPAVQWLEQAPRSFRGIGRELRGVKRPVEKVSEAAEEAEKIADVQGQRRTPQVQVEEPGLADSLWAAVQSFVLGALLTVALLLFLLAFGERLIETLLLLLLPRMRSKASAEIPRAIERQVSAYLQVFLLENVGLALFATLMFWLLGMPSPALWGVLGGMLNFIPYLGAIATASIVGLVGYASFQDIWPALTVAGSYLALTTVEGMFVQPLVFGRRLALNPLAVLLAVALGMWLWGIVGALVAVPCLVVVKAVGDQVAPLKPVASLLG